jgi:glycosyltransferase involved in cell wall biosynthesis
VPTLVVLPTYNEAENVLPLCRDILAVDPTLEILVVDDASPDGTGELVEAAARDEPRLRLLRRPGKLGLGSAYLAGFRFALERGYERVVTMDCDGSHHPRHLADLLADGSDLVIGSRYVPGGGIVNWPRRRRALSALANLYARLLLRLPVRDITSAYRCYRREVLETVDPFAIRASGYSFLEEMAWRVHRAGFRIGEVPIVFEQRTRGVSKIDSSEIYRAAFHVLATALRPAPRRATRASAAGARSEAKPSEGAPPPGAPSAQRGDGERSRTS